MKQILVLLLFTGFVFTSQAQNAVTAKPAPEILQLKEKSFDFGKIRQGRPVTHIFEITNAGKEPLRLENVMASCGCTTPEWSKEPIKPGATASIKVGYNAAAEGHFNKSITISYGNKQTKVILISGIVYKAPTTSAPPNSSLVLLKNN